MCYVLKPLHAESTHLLQNHRTWEHKSHKRGDQSFFFFNGQPSRPVLYSQLIHSDSEYDQNVRPDTMHWTQKARESHTFSLVASLFQSLTTSHLCFGQRGSTPHPPKKKKPGNARTPSFCRSVKCQWEIACGTSTTLNFWTNQPICQTKFMKVPLLEGRRNKGQALITPQHLSDSLCDFVHIWWGSECRFKACYGHSRKDKLCKREDKNVAIGLK